MNTPIRAFIADDEYQCRLMIVKMLGRYFNDIEIVGEAESVEDAVSGISLPSRISFSWTYA